MDFKFKDKNGNLHQIKFNPTQAQQRALDSGIDSNKVAQIEINKNDILTKQDTLTQTQQNAINSGIDSNKVAQIQTNKDDIQTKQATLVSGENIKTINNESLLGSGNINIQASGASMTLLFNGQTGTGGTVATLSQNISNFDIILVEVKGNLNQSEITRADDFTYFFISFCGVNNATGIGLYSRSMEVQKLSDNQVRLSQVFFCVEAQRPQNESAQVEIYGIKL